jgi:toxin FitB
VIVLDTNVVSQLTGETGDDRVLSWFDAQHVPDLAITAITVAELLQGIVSLPRGRGRSDMASRTELVLEGLFEGRSIPFDGSSARHYALVVSRALGAGAKPGVADGQIAAICRQYGAVLATRNVKDFAALGIDLVDPWRHGVAV